MADDTQVVIKTDALTRAYGDNVAVDRLTISIRAGEVFGFLGHNGAGKTTTVRMLNGVIEPTAGSARVFGLDPLVDGARVRARTGVLTETPALDNRMTARATLDYFSEVYAVPPTVRKKRVADLLEQFELTKRANERVGGFSKGMRQRLAIARTLVHDPDIIFLDEPTSGLDPVAMREVHRLIERLSHRGRTVFLCTHNLAEAERLCDRVAVLARGQVLATGTTQELAAELQRGHRISVEIDADNVDRAVGIFAEVPDVTHAEAITDRTVARNGGMTLILHGVARAGVPRVVEAATRAGINLYRVEPVDSSLEDVYFALQER